VTLSTSFTEFIYIRIIAPVASSLPAWFAYGLALMYADARGSLSPTRIQEVVLCLDQVIGSRLSQEAKRRIARDYYRNRVCARVDAMRLAGNGHQLKRLVDIKGEEHIRNALAEGRGGLLCGAHYGSPRSLAGLLGAVGLPVTMLTRWSFGSGGSETGKRPRMNQLVWKPIEHHLRRENITAWRGNISVAVQVAAVLRKNELVLTNVDTRVLGYDRNRAVRVGFMDGQALVLPGPASLSRLTGAPLLPVFIHRSRNWRHLEVEVLPRVSLGVNDVSTMQTLMTIVERLVRYDPAQWELWNLRSLARLGLFPEDEAARFYKSMKGAWEEL
jgi:Kdo2-lipid IVA lauroyltransferase/acyltransferase